MPDRRLEFAGIEDESCPAPGPRFQHGGFITEATENSNDWWVGRWSSGYSKREPFPVYRDELGIGTGNRLLASALFLSIL